LSAQEKAARGFALYQLAAQCANVDDDRHQRLYREFDFAVFGRSAGPSLTHEWIFMRDGDGDDEIVVGVAACERSLSRQYGEQQAIVPSR
jgi:hypothetical protein